jgi:hypothetical protein
MVVLVEGDLSALRKQELPMAWSKGSHDVPYSEFVFTDSVTFRR